MSDQRRGHELLPIGSVVAALQHDYPDVSHSSLRFLEREGLVTPTRTSGGHRLYSPANLQRVRQIKDWQAQRLSLEEIRQRLGVLADVASPDALADAFLERALRGDLPAARRVVLDADDVGLPLEVAFDEVLRPALRQLGDRWAGGDVSVAQEKETSETAREIIAELTLRHARRTASQPASVVAACVAGERHELGLRMMSGLLRSRGINVHFLGADVAPGFLADAVERRRPQAVLLSVTSDTHLPAIREAVAALHDAGHSPTILAGGQAVERHPDIVAGFGVTPATDDPDLLIETLIADVGAKYTDADLGSPA